MLSPLGRAIKMHTNGLGCPCLLLLEEFQGDAACLSRVSLLSSAPWFLVKCSFSTPFWRPTKPPCLLENPRNEGFGLLLLLQAKLNLKRGAAAKKKRVQVMVIILHQAMDFHEETSPQEEAKGRKEMCAKAPLPLYAMIKSWNWRSYRCHNTNGWFRYCCACLHLLAYKWHKNGNHRKKLQDFIMQLNHGIKHSK